MKKQIQKKNDNSQTKSRGKNKDWKKGWVNKIPNKNVRLHVNIINIKMLQIP